MNDHKITIDELPDKDGLINWRCPCGIWGQGYPDDVYEGVQLHLDAVNPPPEGP